MRNRTPSPAALKFMELVREVEAELIAEDVASASDAGPMLTSDSAATA